MSESTGSVCVVTSDLWSQVLGGPTEGFHGGSVGDSFFAEAEVCDLNVSVFVQHEVLQLRKKKQTRILRDNNDKIWTTTRSSLDLDKILTSFWWDLKNVKIFPKISLNLYKAKNYLKRYPQKTLLSIQKGKDLHKILTRLGNLDKTSCQWDNKILTRWHDFWETTMTRSPPDNKILRRQNLYEKSKIFTRSWWDLRERDKIFVRPWQDNKLFGQTTRSLQNELL